MPNWCENFLTVRGPKEDLVRFMEESKHVPEYYYTYRWADEERRKNPYFCFSGLYPIPEDILRADKDQEDICQKAMKAWKAACQKARQANDGNGGREPNLPRLSQFMPPEFDQQARNAWYPWCRDRWGTKWDIGRDAQMEDETDLGKPCIRMFFDTAWTPPVGWMAEAARQFPTLTFTLEYEELGVCFAGVAICRGGELIKDECHNMTEAELRARHPDWDWDDDDAQ